jgi:hypothetical protein
LVGLDPGFVLFTALKILHIHISPRKQTTNQRHSLLNKLSQFKKKIFCSPLSEISKSDPFQYIQNHSFGFHKNSLAFYGLEPGLDLDGADVFYCDFPTPCVHMYVCMYVKYVCRVARWFLFQPKILIWVNFEGLIMENVCIFYDHLAYLRPFDIIYGRLV